MSGEGGGRGEGLHLFNCQCVLADEAEMGEMRDGICFLLLPQPHLSIRRGRGEGGGGRRRREWLL